MHTNRVDGPHRVAATALTVSLCILVLGRLPGAELESVPLGDLMPDSAEQSWGSLQADRSVWDKPLQIGDRRFSRGLGTHANSELVYDLERLEHPSDRLEAWIGVDAAMREHSRASIIFRVLGDGRELFTSGLMRANTPAQHMSVPVAGVRVLKLVVTDAGDGIDADHANWADAVLVRRLAEAAPAKPVRPERFTVGSQSLTLALGLSEGGGIVGARLGQPPVRRLIQGDTMLRKCATDGPVTRNDLPGGGLEFRRRVRLTDREAVGARLTERLLAGADSVRWEVSIEGDGAPWSTDIETRLAWPGTNLVWWTAWDDPEQRSQGWRDPLVFRPLTSSRLWLGERPWDEESSPPGYRPGSGRFVIPLVTLVEPGSSQAVTLALSPEDALLDLALEVGRDGRFAFVRRHHRIAKGAPVRFAMDLVCHEADWRAALRWMTGRYPAYFHPPNPRARVLAGLASYSDWEGDLDVAKLKRMGYGVNWKASYDFPYMGMFLPPIPDDESYPRLVKSNRTSVAQLRDYSRRMKAEGLSVLNYFNVTEFGATTGMPKEPDPSLPRRDWWRNVHNFMRDVVGDGILLDLKGKRFPSWEGCVVMDCGAPNYRAFLIEQARAHVERLPDADGICIDRLDWLRWCNFHADDGLTWRRDQACRTLYSSWRGLMEDLGPIFHGSNKVIFVNAMVNRTDLMRHVDGIYHEFGHNGRELNGTALQCVFKPAMAWTPDENTLRPDPDGYFQRHLYLGVFPTAPLPENDHTIHASAWADQLYLDYGPLMNAMRGRTWVLGPGCVETTTPGVKVNLFQTPAGYALPVMFGDKGASARATVKVRNVNGLERVKCDALHPGSEAAVPVAVSFKNGVLELDVPLVRGCAMVMLK